MKHFFLILSLLVWGFVWFARPELSAQEPDQDRNSAYPNTQRLDIPFTTPADAVSRFRLPDGFQVSLFAAEPDIQQPIAFTLDGRGRLWVVECYTYADGKTNYDQELRDRVVILEDRDGDGTHDQRTVFWDEGEKLTGIEVGFGGIWLTSAPNFLFLADRDGDDRPDGPPAVLLDGFEDDVIRHNIVNGLRWGPDGWLYGRHGIQATSLVGPPGATDSQRTSMNCSIWRYHPTRREFQIVAEGGTNPWGWDYDQHGEMFMINTVIGHLFHVVPGARYERMYGSHFNPHTYQVIDQTADHYHFADGEDWNHVRQHGISDATDRAGGGHAHTGLMVYLGDNWPAEYRNQLFTANFHGLRINRDSIERQGNGYVGRHQEDFARTDDPWFRGIELRYGPAGDVFLLDWSDIGECHENDGIHRTSGRIYRITYGMRKPASEKPISVDAASMEQLLSWHDHPNDWYFRQARRVLQERAEAGMELDEVARNLRGRLNEPTRNTPHRLRALWSLYAIGQLSDDDILTLSGAEDEHLRAWAVRLAADGPSREPSEAVVRRLCEMAGDDSSGLVRLYLASAAAWSGLEPEIRLRILGDLVRHAEDSEDRTQPKLIWYALEKLVPRYPRLASAIAMTSRMPLVRINVARRLAFENDDNDCRVALTQWLQMLSEDDHYAEQRAEVLRGIRLALAGWASAQPLEGWSEWAAEHRGQQPELAADIDAIQLVFGDGVSLERLRETARDGSQDALVRGRAIASVAATKPADLSAWLRSLAGDRAVLTDVVRAAVHCEEPATADWLLDRFDWCDTAGQQATIATLVGRPEWARRLLDAVAQGRLSARRIQAWHARRIEQLNDPGLSRQLAEVWGTVSRSSEERQAEMARMREWLSPRRLATADRGAGRELFAKQCATCHVLQGEGSRIGPDLTGSDRSNLSYLLENLIDPNAMVAEPYQMEVFQLADGRTLSGLILRQDRRTVELQTPEEIVTLPVESIEARRPTRLSLMPEGMLEQMTEQQRVDLIAFLMEGE